MNEKTRLVRELAPQVATLLPGEWVAGWEEATTGAYLISGNMKIFMSGQPHVRDRISFTPHVPQEYRNVGVDAENAMRGINVSDHSDPARIAREITRRIIDAQDYRAKADRQAQRVRDYHTAEANAEALASVLADVLGERVPKGTTKINAWPHGNWEAGNGTAHLSIYLPAELAVKVAEVIMEGYEKHGRSYP